ncbi:MULTISPECIES: XisI protein [unclassified Roseofilum]|uniref:XisI protein n=1 Tax=unclassified Roseofilum TaxID=2620099 RepID=UPI000E8A3AC5|nr:MULTISPECIES: XisI protein [unclassified Roseofilum]MBP0006913.1 XisI protein [Roseofilum sp. Belize Diploria]MBP0032006.1 XisI protein [Roseofilum sp. Belize BBD 4]HBR00756.1 XisI protein [Cyanobacteria bacterium UBA11691]
MGRLDEYRQAVLKVIAEHHKYKSSYGDLEQFIISDTQNDHYQLTSIGWNGDRRIFSSLIHIDIKGDKIWIQHDGTEIGVANQLIELGVPKKAIVLGFHDPNARKFTEFAID